MRFMVMVRSATNDIRPTPELIDAIRKLMADEAKSGRLVARGRLFPEGAELKLGNGRIEVVDGPFAETKEVLGGFSIMEFADLEAAIANAREMLEINARYMPEWRGTVEIRPVAVEIVPATQATAHA
jgi:hypothetical protein